MVTDLFFPPRGFSVLEEDPGKGYDVALAFKVERGAVHPGDLVESLVLSLPSKEDF
jgi:hypothetical protein